MCFSDIGPFLEKCVLNHRKKNSKLINYILFTFSFMKKDLLCSLLDSFISLDLYTASNWNIPAYLFSFLLQDKHFKDIKTKSHPSGSPERCPVSQRWAAPMASWRWDGKAVTFSLTVFTLQVYPAPQSSPLLILLPTTSSQICKKKVETPPQSIEVEELWERGGSSLMWWRVYMCVFADLQSSLTAVAMSAPSVLRLISLCWTCHFLECAEHFPFTGRILAS